MEIRRKQAIDIERIAMSKSDILIFGDICPDNDYKQFSITLTNSSKGKCETSYKKTQTKKKINNSTQDNGFFLTGTTMNIGSTSQQKYLTSTLNSKTKN